MNPYFFLRNFHLGGMYTAEIIDQHFNDGKPDNNGGEYFRSVTNDQCDLLCDLFHGNDNFKNVPGNGDVCTATCYEKRLIRRLPSETFPTTCPFSKHLLKY